jgi:hypothetical protein
MKVSRDSAQKSEEQEFGERASDTWNEYQFDAS